LASPSSFNAASLRTPPTTSRRAVRFGVNGRFQLFGYTVKTLIVVLHQEKDQLYRLVLPSDLVLFCWWRTKIS
jgi:hypothetical protein